MARRAMLVLDANVLIDYVQAERSILELTVKFLGDVFVPDALLDQEVPDLTREACEALGIQVVGATDEQLTEAASAGRKGPLSFYDRLYVTMARDARWVCVTNDRSLRAACKKQMLEVRWGLRLMLDLVAAKALGTDEAVRIATTIAAGNPFITKEVIEEFCEKLRR